MGKVIPRSASPERIFTDFRAALKNGRKAGGEIKKVVEARLAPLEGGVSTAVSDIDTTTEAVDDLEGTLLAVDGGSDLEVGSVLDEVWNALGRPASSIEYTLVAGRGKGQWTDGDPREQPLLMAILGTRVRQSTAFALQEGKEGWARRIEEKAAAQQLVADTLKVAEAKHTVSLGIGRAIADITQVALARLKRDLQNVGLTETQIHDILPDYEPKPRKGAEEKPVEAKPAEAKPAEAKPVAAKPAEAKPAAPEDAVPEPPAAPPVPAA
jgi:hypothetical protein